MFATNPALAAVALVPLPLLAAGALWYTLTAHRRYRAQRQAASAMNALLMDNLQGVRQIKSFGQESHEDARFAGRELRCRARHGADFVGRRLGSCPWKTHLGPIGGLSFLSRAFLRSHPSVAQFKSAFTSRPRCRRTDV